MSPIWLLAFYGITFTLADAKILEWPRSQITKRSEFFYDLFGCYFCLGFWVSLTANIVLWSDRIDSLREYLEHVVLDSFAGASFCLGFNSLLLALESHDRNPEED